MSKLQVMKTTMKHSLGKTGLIFRKYSPELLVGGGIVAVVAGTVVAVKATPKAMDTRSEYDQMREDVDTVNDNRDEYTSKTDSTYTDEDYRKDVTIVTVQRAIAMGKVYLPAVALTTTGIVMILAGHNIIRKRNLAVVAALGGVEKAFGEYRERVVAELGEDKDRGFRFGSYFEDIEVENIDEETGEVTTEKKKVEVFVGEESMYSKIFDNKNRNFSPHSGSSLLFLKAQQNYANDILKSRGHIFLNEVYQMLGFEHTSAGAVVGWVNYGDKNDSYVDFGLYREDNTGFITDSIDKPNSIKAWDSAVMLDFNVDGTIYDLI